MKDHARLVGTRLLNRLFGNKPASYGRFTVYNAKSIPIKHSESLHPLYRYRFGQQGVTLLLLLLAAGFVAVNYNNFLFTIVIFFAVSLFFTSLILSFRNIRALMADVPESMFGFAEQAIHIKMNLSCVRKLHSQNLRIELLDTEGNLITNSVVAVEENCDSIKVSFSQIFHSRGMYQVRQVRVLSLYPVGFVSTCAIFDVNVQIVVFPKPVNVISRSNSVVESHSFQTNNADMLLKSYQEGDAVSRIHWQSVAAERGIFVRYLEETAQNENWVDWFDYPDFPLEQRLSHLTYLIKEADDKKQHYGLRMPNCEIMTGTGIHHRNACLMMLAKYNMEKL